MKSVWVIEEGSYSDYSVVGVFSSKENAELVLESLDSCDAAISEWELDPSVDNLRVGLSLFRVLMLRDGTTELCEKKNLTGYDVGQKNIPHIWERTKAFHYKGKNIPDVLDTTVWAKDEKHAIKIANEQRTRMIAEGKWE